MEIEAIAAYGGNAEKVILERKKYIDLLEEAELGLAEDGSEANPVERAIMSMIETLLDARDLEREDVPPIPPIEAPEVGA